MSAPDREHARVPVFGPEDTGFSLVLEHFERSPHAICRDIARYVHDSNAQFISDPCETLPLPRQLTPGEMCSECRPMGREHFPDADGKALHEFLTGEGYMVLSWPDRTKVAVLSSDGAPPPAEEMQWAYLAARISREAYLAQMAEGGGEWPVH